MSTRVFAGADGPTLVWMNKAQVFCRKSILAIAPCVFALYVFACVCVCFLLFRSIWPEPVLQFRPFLFRFPLANTPLGLPSVLRTILGSVLSLAQACCLAHWRSLQANLSPTKILEDSNHSALPSYRSETVAASTGLGSTAHLERQLEGFVVGFLQPAMMQEVQLLQTNRDSKS